MDPIAKIYPELTVYQFASNTPIQAIDLDGLEAASPEKSTGTVILDYTYDIGVGFGTAALQVLGAITQIGDRIHYGDKIPKEKWDKAFPTIGTKGEVQLMVEGFTAPILAVGDFIQNPSDGKKLGVALFSITPFLKGRLKVKSGALIFEEQAARLVKETGDYSGKLISTLGQNKRGPVASGVLDAKTGKTFFGKNTDQIGELHPILKTRLDKLNADTKGQGTRPEYENEIPGSHAEISALNQALWARQKKYGKVIENQLGEFLLHNRQLKGANKGVGTPDRCGDCQILTKGVTTIQHK